MKKTMKKFRNFRKNKEEHGYERSKKRLIAALPNSFIIGNFHK